MSEFTQHRRIGRGILDSTLSQFLKRAVVVQTLLILAVIWVFVGWTLMADRQQTLETARQQLRTVSAGLLSHVDAILNDAVGAAIASSNVIGDEGGLEALSNDELAQILARHLTGGDYVRALVIATPNRFAQIARDRSAVHEPAPPEWLRTAMAAHGERTYVGPPIEIKSPVGEQVVPVVVRLNQGGNEMWAGALLGLASLESLYRRMQFDSGVLGIFVPNGDVLVRVPPVPIDQVNPETNERRAALVRAQNSLIDEAMFEAKGPITGDLTLFYTRRVTGYSLLVSAGRSVDSILAPWYARARNAVGVLTGFSVVLLALAFMLRKVASNLERRESHYRSLFNNSAMSVFLISGDTFLEANATTYNMFRVPPHVPMDGLHPWDLSPEFQSDGRRSSEAAQEYLRKAQAQGQVQFRWMLKRMDTNEPFPAEVSLSSIQVDNEPLFLAIAIDVTELEAARLQLQALNAELEQRVWERTAALQDANARLAFSNRELEAFTASASHDLRSPLGSIAAQAGMLKEELMTDSVRHRLDRIADSVKRCGDIIDALLSLAKVSRQGLAKESIDLTGLIRSIVDELRQQYPNHSVHCEIPEGLWLEADARLMKSLFANLLDNAWKYTGRSPAPTVKLRWEPRDDSDEFSVADNGAGFDMAYAERIFEPFQRMHSAAEFPGIGVGLATVARIVQRYGGRIWVDSRPGKGTTFHFTLPGAMPRRATHDELRTG
jgi:PAS domain S-box-containing protein